MTDERHEKREVNDHDRLPYDRRKPPQMSFFGHLWNWARSGFTIAMLAGIVIFGVKVVRAHSFWMDQTTQTILFQNEIKTDWHPMILEQKQALSNLNVKIDLLLEMNGIRPPKKR